MFGRHAIRTARATTYRDAQTDERVRELRESEVAMTRVERFRDEAAGGVI
jgi:hypothetical protein